MEGREGFGFVVGGQRIPFFSRRRSLLQTYGTEAEANQAISAMNGQDLDGRGVRVNMGLSTCSVLWNEADLGVANARTGGAVEEVVEVSWRRRIQLWM